MSGYGDTHVGILSDKEALKELSRLLEATTGPAGRLERPLISSAKIPGE